MEITLAHNYTTLKYANQLIIKTILKIIILDHLLIKIKFNKFFKLVIKQILLLLEGVDSSQIELPC